MKSCTFFLLSLLCYFTVFSQGGVKVNTFDKFLKQQRIETDAVALSGLAAKGKLAVSLSSIASTMYLQLDGAGWGAVTVDKDNELVLLFGNDSTISIKSPSLQSFEPGLVQNTYKHKYLLSNEALVLLSRAELTGIRKYSFNTFFDLTIPKASSDKIKRLGTLFLAEIKKQQLLRTLKAINLKDIRNHIGDSVQFCSRVFKTRYFDDSEDGPTLLDVQANFSDPFVNVVILRKDREKFNNAPEKRYAGKDVCINGVVALRDNIPYIEIRNKEQITLRSPVPLEELSFFEGDSVTVSGRVYTARFLEDTKTKPTLINVGAPYPDQPLTLVIENAERKNFTKPEDDYMNKTLKVSGRVVSFKGKPQIVLHTASQVEIIATHEPDPTFAAVKEKRSRNSDGETESNQKEALSKETVAEFPGGLQGFSEFLRNNLINPSSLKENEQRTVVASFEIDITGKCTNIRIVESAGYAFDDEVKRVLMKMPKWKPATLNGGSLTSKMMQSITFKNAEPENRR